MSLQYWTNIKLSPFRSELFEYSRRIPY